MLCSLEKRKMTTLKVKFKKLVKHAFTPEYAKPGDAGMDLVAIDSYKNHDYKFIEYGTGIAVEIPKGFVGLIFPRSSISKTPHSLANAVGVVDSSYRGEIKLRMRYVDEREDMEYSFGDKIGQLMIVPYPEVQLEEAEELSTTERGEEGFGSTGS
jgi:dUTP pyrophosphatase